MTVSVERRRASRIDKVFRVQLATEEHGNRWFVARNISKTGMFVEMEEPIALRTKVIVRFASTLPDGVEPEPGATLTAMARVQNHYYLQFNERDELRSMCGVGLRFLRFVNEAPAAMPPCALH